jgi:hypothetical protein
MTKELLRGVNLVDAVMKARHDKGKALRGMTPGQLAATTLGEQPLTPSLRRWLENDRELFTLGEPQSFKDLVETEFDDEQAFGFVRLFSVLDKPCVLVEGWGSESRRFLYLGATDEVGEYPMFTLDIDDMPYACINGPVDVWLAQHAGYLAKESEYGKVPPAYEAARLRQAELNFRGNLAFFDGKLGKRLS